MFSTISTLRPSMVRPDSRFGLSGCGNLAACAGLAWLLAWLLGTTSAEASPGRPKLTGPTPAFAVTPRGEGTCEQPLWSRDGSAIAYARNFLKDKREFYIVRDFEAQDEVPVYPAGKKSAAGGFLKKATGKNKGRACPSFAWGPLSSPTTYAFTCSAGGRFHLFWNGELRNGKHPAIERISDEKSVNVGEAAWGVRDWALAWVSVSRDVTNGQIWVMKDMQSPEPVLLNPQPQFVQLGPVWSPDGKSMAYYAHEGNKGEADLFVVRDMEKPILSTRQITFGAAIEKNPSWSPDGRRLAYFYIERDGGQIRRQLRVIDAFADAAEPIIVAKDVRPNRGSGPAWTPDGRWIAYVEELKGGQRLSRVRIVQVDKKGPRRRNFPLGTKTASNEDVSLAIRNGEWMLAFTAVDEDPNSDRRWRRVYVYSLEYFRKKREMERAAKTGKSSGKGAHTDPPKQKKKDDSIFLPIDGSSP